MSLQCKTILMDPTGTPLCVPCSFWRELFSRSSRIPMYAGSTVDAAEAFLVRRPGKPVSLSGLQCMRIFFNESGRPAMWHMSIVRIDPLCPLGPEAAPEPRFERRSGDPTFWFPRRDELAAMARVLTKACGSATRLKVTAPAFPHPLAPPPSVVQQSWPQLR